MPESIIVLYSFIHSCNSADNHDLVLLSNPVFLYIPSWTWVSTLLISAIRFFSCVLMMNVHEIISVSWRESAGGNVVPQGPAKWKLKRENDIKI